MKVNKLQTLDFDNFIKIECTWNGYQVQIYSWKLIKCKQTAESKQIFLSFLKYYTLEICDMGKAGFG